MIKKTISAFFIFLLLQTTAAIAGATNEELKGSSSSTSQDVKANKHSPNKRNVSLVLVKKICFIIH